MVGQFAVHNKFFYCADQTFKRAYLKNKDGYDISLCKRIANSSS